MAGQVMEEEWGSRGGERTEEKERKKQIYARVFPAIEPSHKYTERKSDTKLKGSGVKDI